MNPHLSLHQPQWFHRKLCRGEKGTVWRNALALHRGAQVLSGSSDVLFLQLAFVFFEAKSQSWKFPDALAVLFFVLDDILDIGWCWMLFGIEGTDSLFIFASPCRRNIQNWIASAPWMGVMPECPAASSCQVAIEFDAASNAPLPSMNPLGLEHSRLYCCPGCLWKSLPVAPCVMATGCAWRKRGNWHLQLCNQLLDLIMLHCNQVGISRFISVFACRKG